MPSDWRVGETLDHNQSRCHERSRRSTQKMGRTATIAPPFSSQKGMRCPAPADWPRIRAGYRIPRCVVHEPWKVAIEAERPAIPDRRGSEADHRAAQDAASDGDLPLGRGQLEIDRRAREK